MLKRSNAKHSNLSAAWRAAAVSLVALLGASGLGGCYKDGGMGFSSDTYSYSSTSWQPWTVSLVDTRTGESLWSVDVPVGKRLIVGFREGSGPNRVKPDMMRWGILEGNRTVGTFQNQMPVPPITSRRLEPTLRAVPEMPQAPLPGSPYEDVNWSLQKQGEVGDGKADVMGAPKLPPVIKRDEPAPAPAPAMEPETVKPSDAPPVEPAPAPTPAPQEQPKQDEPAKPEEPPVDLPGR